ncbi:MAG: PEP-CTERM sorting domain-containing protein [Fimbriimonas sp.]
MSNLARPFFVVCLAGSAITNSFAGTLDQHNEGPLSPDPNGAFAYNFQTPVQTFTVGVTGLIDQIDLQVGRIGTPTQSITVEVFKTTGVSSFVPSGSVLFSHTFNPTFFPTSTAVFTSINFGDYFASPIDATVGETYAIRLSSPEASTFSNQFYVWNLSGGNQYSGGHFSGSSDQDMGFRTYVITPVPEPASMVAMSLGLVAFARRRNRK